MNELDAWDEILLEWKKVKRMKKLVQELYEQVGGTLFYMLDYAKKNNIILPNREGLYRMADRIHYLMDEIEPPTESQQLNKTTDDSTEPNFLTMYYILK